MKRIGVVVAVLLFVLLALVVASWPGDRVVEVKGTTNLDALALDSGLTAGTTIGAGTAITAGTYLTTATYVKSGAGITATSAISAGQYVDAGQYLNAGTYVKSGTNVTATTYVSAGQYVDAGQYLKAGENVTATTYVNAGTYVTGTSYIGSGGYGKLGTFLILDVQPVVTVVEGLTITPTGTYQPISASGAVSTSLETAVLTPTTPTGTAVWLVNEGSDAITIVNGANTALPSASDLVLGANDAVLLQWNGSDWIARSSVNN